MEFGINIEPYAKYGVLQRIVGVSPTYLYLEAYICGSAPLDCMTRPEDPGSTTESLPPSKFERKEIAYESVIR
jgi:hypothetical protein